jgi:putative transposase
MIFVTCCRSIVSSADSIECSMSARGGCNDNAPVERFFSLLKLERVKRQTYQTGQEAKANVFDYIGVSYNRKRRPAYLGYTSPVEYEKHPIGLNRVVRITGAKPVDWGCPALGRFQASTLRWTQSASFRRMILPHEATTKWTSKTCHRLIEPCCCAWTVSRSRWGRPTL